jgi:prevent-host-death family protein
VKERYSVYEAKARLSEILRAVKRRRRITITERGVPVAEVVPYEPPAVRTLADRVQELEAQGAILPASAAPASVRRIARRRGALRRFLESRD